MTFALEFWMTAWFAACILACYTGSILGLYAMINDEIEDGWNEQDYRSELLMTPRGLVRRDDRDILTHDDPHDPV